MASINILDKYHEETEQAKSFLTFGRNIFSTWTLSKITHLAFIMVPKDFYHLLVQSEFIDTSNVLCEKCNDKMSLYSNAHRADGVQWECKKSKLLPGMSITKGKCNTSKSARTNSWFFNSKLSLPEVLLITYHWWYQVPLKMMRREYGFTDRTLCDWASYCREVAIDAVFNQSEKIGGPNIVVEIDESKFGKRRLKKKNHNQIIIP